MKPQTPAEGVYLRKDWGNAITYGVTCECGDDNHTHNLWVEADDDRVTVTIFTQQKTKWWEQSRWRTIWTLLTKGYVEYDADIIMSEQQALNYANVLQSASAKVKEHRLTKNVKN